jgi:ribonuclease III
MEEFRKQQILDILSGEYFQITECNEEKLALYNKALTHTSYTQEMTNFERLEFLGNYVLDCVIADVLYESSELQPGEMNKRMKVTKNTNLAEIVMRKNLGIDKAILHGKGMRVKDSMIADAFEAFIGAIYKNEGMDTVKEIIQGIFSDEIEKTGQDTDFKRTLQEYVQKNGLGKLEYKHIRSGAAHEIIWTARVVIGKKTYEEGRGPSKPRAEMQAAKKTLKKICEQKGVYSHKKSTISSRSIPACGIPEMCRVLGGRTRTPGRTLRASFPDSRRDDSIPSTDSAQAPPSPEF